MSPLMAFFVAIMLIPSCGKRADREDKEEILSILKRGAQLAEKHDADGLMAMTTEDFRVEPDGFGRREARRILLWVFRNYGDFRIIYPRPRIEVRAEEGVASVVAPFLVLKTGQQFPGLKELYEDPEGWIEEVGEQADLHALKLMLEKEGGEWRVSAAEVRSLTDLGLEE